jgi:hypothetical protein
MGLIIGSTLFKPEKTPFSGFDSGLLACDIGEFAPKN